MNEPKKLHIGAGDHILPGWLNTDLTPLRADVVMMDATQPFPFKSEYFDYIFSEHMIEHMSYDGGQVMLKECYRVLKNDGKLRISCPHTEFIREITANNPIPEITRYIAWFGEFFDIKTARTVAAKLRYGFGHQYIYSAPELVECLKNAGFSEIFGKRLMQSDDPNLCELENVGRMPEGLLQLETMTFEATKRRAADE